MRGVCCAHSGCARCPWWVPAGQVLPSQGWACSPAEETRRGGEARSGGQGRVTGSSEEARPTLKKKRQQLSPGPAVGELGRPGRDQRPTAGRQGRLGLCGPSTWRGHERFGRRTTPRIRQPQGIRRATGKGLEVRRWRARAEACVFTDRDRRSGQPAAREFRPVHVNEEHGHKRGLV